MFRLEEWRARNGGKKRFGTRQGRLWVAIHLSVAALVAGTPTGLSAAAEDVPRGPYYRVKGLPAGVTGSGGQTNAEHTWVVPLWAADDLKIEIPAGLSGNLDLLFGLVDVGDVVLSERTVEVRVTPAVVATPSRLEPGATQSMDAAVTPPPPPLSGEALNAVVAPSASSPSGAASGEAAAVAGGPEPKAAQREDAVVAPSASPPSGAASGEAAAVAGGPEPKAAQREDAVVATSAPPPRGAASGEAVAAAPSGSEPKAAQRKDATVATAAPSAIGLAATFVKRGQDFIANGDLAAARLVLRRAADGGDAQAAQLLGSTYDPAVFKQLKVIGLAPDPAQARVWYQRAVDLGSAR